MALYANAEPARPLTVGERLDAHHEVTEQMLDYLDEMAAGDRQRIAALERQVAVLEALLIGTGAAR
jgi:hypothetical protein